MDAEGGLQLSAHSRLTTTLNVCTLMQLKRTAGIVLPARVPYRWLIDCQDESTIITYIIHYDKANSLYLTPLAH